MPATSLSAPSGARVDPGLAAAFVEREVLDRELQQAIRAVYKGNPLWEVLDDFGPSDGGCLICAKAIIRAADRGELVRLVDAETGMTQHYGARLDGHIYDFNGAYPNSMAWARHFARLEHIKKGLNVEVGLDPGPSDIPDDPPKEKAIAKLLENALSGAKG